MVAWDAVLLALIHHRSSMVRSVGKLTLVGGVHGGRPTSVGCWNIVWPTRHDPAARCQGTPLSPWVLTFNSTDIVSER